MKAWLPDVFRLAGRAALFGALSVVGCTKAQDPQTSAERSTEISEPTKIAPEASRARQPVPLPRSTDLTKFAPLRADKIAVVIRFDHMRGTPLAAATERLVGWLPDHRRIVGDSKAHVQNYFDTVLISSSEPRSIDATNMAASMHVTASTMRALLNNRAASTVWTPVQGGALGTTTMEGYSAPDRRLYLIPLKKWIVMAPRRAFDTLLAPREGSLADRPKRELLVPWLAQLPQLSRVGGPGLMSMATLKDLPSHMEAPVLGRFATPVRADIALHRRKTIDIFHGEFQFHSEEDAVNFASIIETAKALYGNPVTRLAAPNLPADDALAGLTIQQTGKRLDFSLPTSRSQSVEIVDFTAARLGEWTTQWPLDHRSPSDPGSDYANP